jgi:hypothetical protein
VLPDWLVTPDIGVFALYAHTSKSSPNVRAFVSVIEAGLRQALGADAEAPVR